MADKRTETKKTRTVKNKTISSNQTPNRRTRRKKETSIEQEFIEDIYTDVEERTEPVPVPETEPVTEPITVPETEPVTEPEIVIEEHQVEEPTINEPIEEDEEESKKVVKTVYRLKKIKGFHFGFNARIVLNVLTIIILSIAIIYTLKMSFKLPEDEVIKYKENSTIDYKVYLKENDFYEQEYLEKGMAYVASLIDNIKINYNYFFSVDKESDIEIENKVIAKLIITSQSNSNVFFEKEYELSPAKSEELQKGKSYALKKEVDIDYGYYNNLANRFRSNYAVNTTSTLEVYLQIKEKNKNTNEYQLTNENKTVLTIPLSEQEINISLDNKNVNDEKQIVKKSEFKISNPTYLIISGVIALLIIIELIRLIKKILLLQKKVNKYDKYINKILRGYDRVIVNVKTAPNLDNYNVIKVESFEELIDVRDNIKEPIKYLVIQEHQKSEFFITNHIDLYLYVVKEVDLDGEQKK